MPNKLNRLRDDIACAIANFALNYIATQRYRDLIDGAIRLGIETAKEEQDDGIFCPTCNAERIPGEGAFLNFDCQDCLDWWEND